MVFLLWYLLQRCYYVATQSTEITKTCNRSRRPMLLMMTLGFKLILMWLVVQQSEQQDCFYMFFTSLELLRVRATLIGRSQNDEVATSH